jgi:hypothetical protein
MDTLAYNLETSGVSLINHMQPFSFGCVLNGYWWGSNFHTNMMRWSRHAINDEPEFELMHQRLNISVWHLHPRQETEFELLAIPEVATVHEGVERSHWTPMFCLPALDGKGLIVGGHYEIILLRFE